MHWCKPFKKLSHPVHVDVSYLQENVIFNELIQNLTSKHRSNLANAVLQSPRQSPHLLDFSTNCSYDEVCKMQTLSGLKVWKIYGINQYRDIQPWGHMQHLPLSRNPRPTTRQKHTDVEEESEGRGKSGRCRIRHVRKLITKDIFNFARKTIIWHTFYAKAN